MFGENASFIKTVEIDDSIFQCNPECAKKYLLQLEWSRDNEAWQWKVLKSEDVLTSNDASDHEAIEALMSDISVILDLYSEEGMRGNVYFEPEKFISISLDIDPETGDPKINAYPYGMTNSDMRKDLFESLDFEGVKKIIKTGFLTSTKVALYKCYKKQTKANFENARTALEAQCINS